MTGVERRKASAPPLQLRANAGRGANVARAAHAGRLIFLRRGGNQWCACRRSASLLLREAPRAFLKREAKLGCEAASRERGRFMHFSPPAGREEDASVTDRAPLIPAQAGMGPRFRGDERRESGDERGEKRRGPRPLHHPAARGGPPPPLAWGRMGANL